MWSLTMGLFVRSSIRTIQCAKKICYSTVALDSVKLKTVTRRINHYDLFNSIIASDLIINKKLSSNGVMEENQWASVRKDLLNTFQIQENNVDSKMYDLCFYYNRLDEATRYFQFLERNNYKLNLNIIGTYLKIYYLKKKPVTAEEEEEILRVYDNLRKEYPLLDGKTSSDCILGLSLTKEWKESFKLLDMLKVSSSPGIIVISAIISAAFRNNDVQTGWKLMTESIEKFPMEPQVYEEYLNYCKQNFDNGTLQGELEKMFFFWKEYDVQPTECVVNNYADVFESFGYTAVHTSVLKKGQCSYCSHVLPQTSLNAVDFKTLSTSILKNVIVGKDVYCTTSPQELKNYLLFVQTMKPYDVVIDGLNVAYGSRRAGQPGSLKSVLNVVNHFYNIKKRVLVIGRVHMNWWSNEQMKALHKLADVYLTKNLSQDDPFLLHITLLSGPQAYFVSRDLMRQHRFKLVDSNLQMLFKRWQISRQYTFHKLPNMQEIKLIPPMTFEISTQKNNDDWHIPYSHSQGLYAPQNYSIPKNWLCLKKKAIFKT